MNQPNHRDAPNESSLGHRVPCVNRALESVVLVPRQSNRVCSNTALCKTNINCYESITVLSAPARLFAFILWPFRSTLCFVPVLRTRNSTELRIDIAVCAPSTIGNLLLAQTMFCELVVLLLRIGVVSENLEFLSCIYN